MIPSEAFGRTGHVSTRVIFGAAALWDVSQAEADRVLELLVRFGVNHIDTAPSYGEAELRVGPWMAEHRDRFFLATKTDQREYEAARDQIRRSLERLRVDHVDLIQLHHLIDPAEWDTAMAPGGALEAVIEARDEGLARFIGVTGHGLSAPATHRRSLARFDFDTVLLPYSFVTMSMPHYRDDFEALMAVCGERNVAVQAIKGLLRRPWPEGAEHTRTTWYEPLEDQAAVDAAVAWVLGRPRIFLITPGDTAVLPRVLEAADRIGEVTSDGLPTDAEMRELIASQEMRSLFV
jgi:aryl-alcohol dehydrogenase-like predicted oxidoreductase